MTGERVTFEGLKGNPWRVRRVTNRARREEVGEIAESRKQIAVLSEEGRGEREKAESREEGRARRRSRGSRDPTNG